MQGVDAELAASPPTYEMISGAIAMSRMARALGDEPMPQRFATEAVKLMQAGTSFETFRRNAHVVYSGKPDWFRGCDGIAFDWVPVPLALRESYFLRAKIMVKIKHVISRTSKIERRTQRYAPDATE